MCEEAGTAEAGPAGMEGQGQATSSTAEAASSAKSAEAAAAPVPHYRMDSHSGEQELEAMYDFKNFDRDRADSTAVEEAAARRVRLVEAKLKERERALQAKMEAQEKKLAAASRQLAKSRNQVQQLGAQLGLRDLEGNRLQNQVTQLRGLLVDKERRLQDAMDGRAAAEAALLAASSRAPSDIVSMIGDEDDCSSVAGRSVRSMRSVRSGRSGRSMRSLQQPQEPPDGCGSEDSFRPAVDEGQLLQISKIAEELTEALETEQAARRKKEEEVNELLDRLRKQEQDLARERTRAKEHEVRANRVLVEDHLQQVLAKKGKNHFHPHLEV